MEMRHRESEQDDESEATFLVIDTLQSVGINARYMFVWSGIYDRNVALRRTDIDIDWFSTSILLAPVASNRFNKGRCPNIIYVVENRE